MRIFVRCDQNGNIVSTMKVNVMPEDMEHPYGGLEEGETVLEIEPTAELEALACHEIGEQFVVDTQQKKMSRKPG